MLADTLYAEAIALTALLHGVVGIAKAGERTYAEKFVGLPRLSSDPLRGIGLISDIGEIFIAVPEADNVDLSSRVNDFTNNAPNSDDAVIQVSSYDK